MPRQGYDLVCHRSPGRKYDSGYGKHISGTSQRCPKPSFLPGCAFFFAPFWHSFCALPLGTNLPRFSWLEANPLPGVSYPLAFIVIWRSHGTNFRRHIPHHLLINALNADALRPHHDNRYPTGRNNLTGWE